MRTLEKEGCVLKKILKKHEVGKAMGKLPKNKFC